MSFNFGKWKLLLYQAGTVLFFPVTVVTNAMMVFSIFGTDAALLVLGAIGLMFVGIIVFIDRVTVGQETAFAWEKCTAFTDFRREIYERLDRMELEMKKC